MTDMFPDRGPDWRIKLKRLLLDVDARLDFSVFQGGKWAREIYERFTAIMDRFQRKPMLREEIRHQRAQLTVIVD